LSVSYDNSLLKTRELILADRGYQVTSATGFVEALAACQRPGPFDAFVIGHSIPHLEKEALIEAFRTNSCGRVIALKKMGERQVQGADVEIQPDPEHLLHTLAVMVSGRPEPEL
jgi:hypothetical protein